MTQENKDLVLRDLCARIPYGVKVKAERVHKDSLSFVGVDDNSYICKTPSGSVICIPFNFDITPYLRPMLSMTEEEKKELKFMCDIGPETLTNDSWINGEFGLGVVYKNNASICVDAIDWLNAHHFDYRGLIKKGLAIEAPEGMYN